MGFADHPEDMEVKYGVTWFKTSQRQAMTRPDRPCGAEHVYVVSGPAHIGASLQERPRLHSPILYSNYYYHMICFSYQ